MKVRRSVDKSKSISRLTLPKLSLTQTRSAELSPVPQRINEFIKCEKQKEMKISYNRTRDVSYIQDNIPKHSSKEKPEDFMSELYHSAYSLPTDLDHLRKILNSTDELGIPVTINHFGYAELLHCKKKMCVDRAIMVKNKNSPLINTPKRANLHETDAFLEKLLGTEDVKSPESSAKRMLFLGSPTGRQEVENLRKWLKCIKSQYLQDADKSLDNDEEIKSETIEAGYIIYSVIIKELIRQVTVHCIERGELLKECIDSLSKFWKKSTQSYILSSNNMKDRHAAEVASIKYLNAKQTAKYQVKINQLTEELEMAKQSEERCMKDVEFLRNLVTELKRKHRRKISQMIGDEVNNVAQTNKREYSRPVSKISSPVSKSQSPAQSVKSSEKMRKKGSNDADYLYPPVEGEGSSVSIVSLAYQTDLSRDSHIEEETIQEDILDSHLQKKIEEKETEVLQGNKLNYEPNTLALGFENAESAFYIPPFNSRSISSDRLEIESLGTQFLSIDFTSLTSHSLASNAQPGSDIQETQQRRQLDIDLPEIHNRLDIQEDPSIEQVKLNIPDTPHRSSGNTSQPHKISHKSLSLISDKDINISPESMIIQEFTRKQEALEEISAKIKQAKLKIKELDHKISVKTQQIESLESEVSCCKADLVSLTHPEASSTAQPKTQRRSSLNFTPLNPSKLEENHIIEHEISLRGSDTSRVQPEICSTVQTNQGIEILVSDFDKSVSHLELIPASADSASWRAGFNTGFESGKIEGMALGEEIGMDKGISEGYRKALIEQNLKSQGYLSIENPAGDSSIIDSDCEDISIRSDTEEIDQYSPPRNGIRTGFNSFNSRRGSESNLRPPNIRGTKFEEFSFKRESHGRKSNPSRGLVINFLSKKSSVINRYATMGIHMLLRHISLVYVSTLSKLKSSESFDTFIDILYEELSRKYGMKKVAEKKFKEVIASMLYHSSFRRVSMLLKLSGIGERISMKSYSYLSCKMYIDLLNFMQNYNVGIMLAIDDTAEIQMYPTVRALECIKEKLEPLLDKADLNGLVKFVEAKSVSDPKRINKSGLIELELFLEKAIELYEEYQENISQGVNAVMSKTYGGDISYLLKSDAVDLVRNVSPMKISGVQKMMDGEIIDIVQFGRGDFETESCAGHQISMNNFKNICILNNCLSLKEVQAYLQIPM